VILHGSQSLFSVFNTNLPADLITPYSVLVYGLLALVILVADWRRWFAHPAQEAFGKAIRVDASAAN
jgi:hypothetical protein